MTKKMRNNSNTSTDNPSGFRLLSKFLSLLIAFSTFIFYVPFILFFILWPLETKETSAYLYGALFIALGTIGEFFLARFAYRHTHNTIIKRIHPSQYFVGDDIMTYRQYHPTYKRQVINSISYEQIKECVVSPSNRTTPHGLFKPVELFNIMVESVLKQDGMDVNLLIYIIYEDKKEVAFFSCDVEDTESANELLGAMEQHDIPLKWTTSDIDSIPWNQVIRTLEEVDTEVFTYDGNIQRIPTS